DILFHEFLTDENSVFVVVSFPRHKGNKCVASESKFTFVGCRSICKNGALFYSLTLLDNHLLVDTGGLIASDKLSDFVNVFLTVVAFDNDLPCCGSFYHTWVL